MTSGSVLVIGLGEVGRPLYEILSECFEVVYGYDCDSSRTIDRPVSYTHLTLPTTERV